MTRPGSIRRNKRSGIFDFASPMANSRFCRWICTGERDEQRALALIRETGVEELTRLYLAQRLTAETIAAVTTGRNLTCAEVKAGWIDWMSRINAPITIECYGYEIERLFRDLNAHRRPLSWISETDLHAFINEGGRKLASRGQRMKACRSLWKWAHAKGYILGNPAMLVRINYRSMTVEQMETVHHEPISEADYLKLISCPDVAPFWREAFVLGYCGGLRFCDCCCLEWASLQPGGLIIYPRKNRQKRLVLRINDHLVFRPELRVMLEQKMREPREDPIYVWFEAAASYLNGAVRKNMWQECAFQMRMAGVVGPTFHSLRTAFARRLYAAGRSMEDVANAMGHGAIAVTCGYLGVLPKGPGISLPWPLSCDHLAPPVQNELGMPSLVELPPLEPEEAEEPAEFAADQSEGEELTG